MPLGAGGASQFEPAAASGLKCWRSFSGFGFGVFGLGLARRREGGASRLNFRVSAFRIERLETHMLGNCTRVRVSCASRLALVKLKGLRVWLEMV